MNEAQEDGQRPPRVAAILDALEVAALVHTGLVEPLHGVEQQVECRRQMLACQHLQKSQTSGNLNAHTDGNNRDDVNVGGCFRSCLSVRLNTTTSTTTLKIKLKH